MIGVRRKHTVVKYGLAAAFASAGLYLGVLLTASAMSRGKVLGPGEHESSPLHKRIYFGLAAQVKPAGN